MYEVIAKVRQEVVSERNWKADSEACFFPTPKSSCARASCSTFVYLSIKYKAPSSPWAGFVPSSPLAQTHIPSQQWVNPRKRCNCFRGRCLGRRVGRTLITTIRAVGGLQKEAHHFLSLSSAVHLELFKKKNKLSETLSISCTCYL